MKKTVTIKLSGNEVNVAEAVKELKAVFNARQTSRFIPNRPQEGVHCYVMLFPDDVVQRLGVPRSH